MSYRRNTINDFSPSEREQLVYIAAGSNLSSIHGGPRQTVEVALTRLAALSLRPLVHSSLWQTAPVDCPLGSGSFINAVVALLPRSNTCADDLLHRLQELEKEFGRQRSGTVNAARPLDLDMIAFGALRQNEPGLTLPHPRAHLRRFVLQPLAEIASDYVLPGFSEPVKQQLASCDDQGWIERLF